MVDSIIIDSNWERRLEAIKQNQVVRCGEIYINWLHAIGIAFPILADKYKTKERERPYDSQVSMKVDGLFVMSWNGKDWLASDQSIATFEHANDYCIMFQKLYNVCDVIKRLYYEEVAAYYGDNGVKTFFDYLLQVNPYFKLIGDVNIAKEIALVKKLQEIYKLNSNLLEQQWGKQERTNAIKGKEEVVEIDDTIDTMMVQTKAHKFYKLEEGESEYILKTFVHKIEKHKKVHDAIQTLHEVAGSGNGSKWEQMSLYDNFNNILTAFQSKIQSFLKELCPSGTVSVTCDKLQEYYNVLEGIKKSLTEKEVNIENIVAAIKKSFNTKLKYDSDDAPSIIRSVGKYHADFLDDMFPFRTVLNFRTFFDREELPDPEKKYADAAKKNFEKLIDDKIDSFDNTQPDSTQLLSVKYTPTNTKFGPYYQVLNGGSGLAVESDIEAVVRNTEPKKKHCIYSAYGYSGSGKTYDLINSKGSILERILQSLPHEHHLELLVYDLYGEIIDDGCITPGESPSRDDYTNLSKRLIEDITLFKMKEDSEVEYLTISKDIHKNNGEKLLEEMKGSYNDYKMTLPKDDTRVSKVKQILTQINKQRKKNFVIEKKEEVGWTAQKFHIRATPNNSESSRSHLFVDIYVCDPTDTSLSIGKITIMDMGGSEDVNAIQNDYFIPQKVTRIQEVSEDVIAKTAKSRSNPLLFLKKTEENRFLLKNLKPWLELYNTYPNEMPLEYLNFVYKNDFYLLRQLRLDIARAKTFLESKTLNKFRLSPKFKKALDIANASIIEALSLIHI